ncbi:DUF4395 domain-containing protein [Sporosarcina beigongshangi]|uniref:DUF4395 domain-containing protein n=1 Tax=Sporosarcina beigongshangi TaxID=2782538 RepID=UPI00193A0F22|nr:DUF4395 domain-containing protein [Sporosarcina beigongshangi]
MTIPKPLVQLNQAFILTTVLLGLFIHPSILLLPFLIGVYTLVTKQNPIILLGKRFLRNPANTYHQEDKAQQIFNQWIATICIGLSLLFFSFNLPTIAFIFGFMVIAASGIALMGYCIGCTIRYRYMMWRSHRA